VQAAEPHLSAAQHTFDDFFYIASSKWGKRHHLPSETNFNFELGLGSVFMTFCEAARSTGLLLLARWLSAGPSLDTHIRITIQMAVPSIVSPGMLREWRLPAELRP
jgi:hypothetical protein